MIAFPLRPYQRAAVDAVHAAAARGLRRPLVAMATGLGKSLAAAHVVKERAGRAVLLAHRDELMRQLERSVKNANPDARTGIVKADEDNVTADVVIASLQTLARPSRLQRLLDSQRGDMFTAGRPFVTVIADEAHHHTGGDDENTFGAVLRGLGAFDPDGPLTVGWTATPERGDGKALGAVWEEIVYEMGILDGISQGFLCDLKAKQIKLAADFNRLKVRAGEFRDEESAEMLLEADAPKHAAEAYLQHAKGLRSLAFTPTIAVAKAFAEAFCAAGVPAEAAHGGMELEERRAIMGRLERGETLVVPNAQLFTEGTDIPSVACIIVAKPTRSRPAYVQMVGRGTRIYPGKTHCLILDLVGVSHRHDLTTMATLFGVTPEAAEEGIAVAVEKKKAGSKSKAGSSALDDETVDGRLVSVDIELFTRRAFAWIAAGAKFVLSLGLEGNLVLEPGTEPDVWNVAKVKREKLPGRKWPTDVKTKLYAGLPLEMAQGAAEDLVRKSGAAALNVKDAGWRKTPPSDKQRVILERRGKWRPDMTKGEASDLLTAMFAR